MKKHIKVIIAILTIICLLSSSFVYISAASSEEESSSEEFIYRSIEAKYLTETLKQYVNSGAQSAVFFSQDCVLSTGENGYCRIGYNAEASSFYVQILSTTNYYWSYKFDLDYVWKYRVAYHSDNETWETVDGFAIKFKNHNNGNELSIDDLDSRCRLLFKEIEEEKIYHPISSEDLAAIRTSFITNLEPSRIIYSGWVELSTGEFCNANFGWSADVNSFYIQPLTNNPSWKWAYKFADFGTSVSWAYRDINTNDSFTLIDDFSIKFIDKNTSRCVDCPSALTFLFEHKEESSDIIQEGKYFIKNKKSNEYVQLKSSAAPDYCDEDIELELSSFDGYEYQQWNLEYIGNGYYKILSAKTGLAVSIYKYEQNIENACLVQEIYYGSPRQQWKIELTARGTYIITPKLSEINNKNWSLSIGNGKLLSTNKHYISQRNYIDDNDYRDEWRLIPVCSNGDETITEIFFYELISTYDFSPSEASLIRSVYDRVDQVYSNESSTKRAWISSRILGGLIYDKEFTDEVKWNDVAGKVITSKPGQSTADAEKEFFTETLGYSSKQYDTLLSAVENNYKSQNSADFAHMQISLSARLAYNLGLTGILSNIYTLFSDEDVSYLAGWFGDSILTTSLKNDDYCADLDAENIYRLIDQGYSIVNATNSYYCEISSGISRATKFLSYIDYSIVKGKIFHELVDKELDFLYSNGSIPLSDYLNKRNSEPYHLAVLNMRYPDTYRFLMSLQNRANEIY